MVVPFSWLKDYVDIDVSAEELQAKLFSCGFEVENLTYLGKDVTGVVTGRITKTEKHPDADRLTVCTVDCGSHGVKQICTAATNVYAGAIVPCALDGATVLHEGGIQKIKTGKLRGVASEGMFCSGEELGINNDWYDGAETYGILILDENTPVGEDIRPVVGLDDWLFDIAVTVTGGGHKAYVHITGNHTNVVRIEKDGVSLLSRSEGEEGGSAGAENMTDRSVLTVENIVRYADTVPLAEVEDVISRQIEYNSAIAEEGLRGDYGANIGKILLRAYGNSVHNRAKATAAAGSDARMNGCSLPVVIVSGSGNQGMTASLPVIVYAKELGATREQLIRAIVVSDLITVHLKTGIGTLSAYCGAVSAGCGAGAGVCYLRGGSYKEIAHTIVNALAIESGVICDGAKSSCAAKVASAVEAGLVGMEMYRRGSEFIGGDGIVEKGVENTIRAVGDLARNGMRETDEEIIRLMIRQLA